MVGSIIFCSIGVASCGIAFYLSRNTSKINLDVKLKNQKILEEQAELQKSKKELENQINLLDFEIKNKNDKIKNINLSISIAQENQEKLQSYSNNAFLMYQENLENRYNEVEAEYDRMTDLLKSSYEQAQDEIKAETDRENAELDKIRATRAAAQEAIIREKEIKEQQSFYCIQLTDIEKKDIKVLDGVKPSLVNPRILCMLIWQTYYSKKLKALSENVLGKENVCGIYKITNQLTDECYIGQAKSVAKRWTEHAKAGLGIDTPQGNKLYAAMQKDGLWNFSWELLEECPSEQLNQKEKYYINLYMANQFNNYNSTKGNN